MKKLSKKLITEMIEEFLSIGDTPFNGGQVLSSEPVARYGEYDVNNDMVVYEEMAQSIVVRLNDMENAIRTGLTTGEITPETANKIMDFQISRIQRALNSVANVIEAKEGYPLDMTTPEV